jgi:arylsulfate sulfotransferase
MRQLRLSPSFLLSVIFSLCGLTLACGAGLNQTPPPVGAVASTQNPLVAQYSIVSGCPGPAMVEFGPDTSYGRGTAWYSIPGHYQRSNILVAGMRASTTYHMRSHVQCFGNELTSADLTFTTGPLPSTPFPTLKMSRPTPSLSSTENPGIELIDIIDASQNLIQALFTDRDANPIWYYDVGQGNSPYTMKLLPNGHLIVSISRPADDILREVDLAGNTIREMDVTALARKMQAAGFDFVSGSYHHDLAPLANGHLLVLVNFTKEFTDLPGYPGTTHVLGDGIVDLDTNWNPVWAWNSFDYLDVNRHLNGLPDWTHSNALLYSASDGNILLSMRHQSWVLKIDYSNGTGTGNIAWKLGYQGDFSLTEGDDPSLWFSFQHFPSIISQSGPQTTLALWDNGDNRVLDDSGTICGSAPSFVSCYSRATIFQIDESAMVANLLWADRPGYFSVWGGSINQLSGGNVEFDINAGVPTPDGNAASEVQEVSQTSAPQVVWQMDILPAPSYAYRAYRVPSLYPGVAWQY